MCKVERVQEEGQSGRTPQHSPVRGARLRAGLSLLGSPGESWNLWFLKGLRAVLESLLWSVLNPIHAPGEFSDRSDPRVQIGKGTQMAVTEVLCLSSEVHFYGSSWCLFSFRCKSRIGGMFRCKSHVSVGKIWPFRMCLEKIFLLKLQIILRLSSFSQHFSSTVLSLPLHPAISQIDM